MTGFCGVTTRRSDWLRFISQIEINKCDTYAQAGNMEPLKAQWSAEKVEWVKLLSRFFLYIRGFPRNETTRKSYEVMTLLRKCHWQKELFAINYSQKLSRNYSEQGLFEMESSCEKINVSLLPTTCIYLHKTAILFSTLDNSSKTPVEFAKWKKNTQK